MNGKKPDKKNDCHFTLQERKRLRKLFVKSIAIDWSKISNKSKKQNRMNNGIGENNNNNRDSLS